MGSKKNIVKSVKSNQRSYLNKDFSAFRTELSQYGQIYFKDKINDFSEAGLAGMFIELAAMVGDNMSFYLDHQFGELDLLTAIEPANVEKLVRSAGVKIRGAAPATITVNFYLEAPAILKDNDYVPDVSVLPRIEAGTIVVSSSGVKFELMDPVNFAETDQDGKIRAIYATMKTDADRNPTSFGVKKSGFCTSGLTIAETFDIPDKFVPFRSITLASSDISDIISVKDTDGNQYYQVEALTQDVVYKRILNTTSDSDFVSENLELIPAPRRYISEMSRQTGKTTIKFGSGNANSTDDDIMPDPADLSLPLYGKRKTFSRFTLDPNKLLQTRTLGVSPRNTTISIRYRAGGGLRDNVAAGSIKTISTLITKFPATTLSSRIASIRASMRVTNTEAAEGGESPMTLNELRSAALAFRNSQSRIVTREDLIARIYTMPSNFGRVFRVGLRDNPSNPLASVVSIISRDSVGKLIVSPDTLKENLRLYLNEYRLISDAIDIVDAKVINVGIRYQVVIDSTANSTLTIQKINNSLKQYMLIENFQIDQPVMKSDLLNIILNTSGVLSLVTFNIVNLTGAKGANIYSKVTFSVTANTDREIITPPPGSIFEVRYPDDDIIGIAR
tara:strand:- start:7019 stop:8869 length:1851 start_codon:yes stop_codon:yes gene_type:complete